MAAFWLAAFWKNGLELGLIMDCCGETNISIGHISQCCNNVYGRKTAGGYHWQYYNIDKVESEEK